MITALDPRVETLAYFASKRCTEQRMAYYSEAMRAVNTGRGQIGGLLYDLNAATVDLLSGLLLSSVIKRKWMDWPGEGYFSCAVALGVGLPVDADVVTQRRFWEKRIRGLFDYYERLKGI